MRPPVFFASLVALAAGCHIRAQVPLALAPLADEGEVFVYLDRLPEDASRLGLSFESAALIRPDGSAAAIELLLPRVTGAAASNQRLLAWGRLPPGHYSALQLQLARATLAAAEGDADLLVPGAPLRIDGPLDIERGRAVVVQLALRPGQALERGFGFTGEFTSVVLRAPSSVVQTSNYCSSSGQASLTAFDRHSSQLTAIIPTGREPTGVALDSRSGRAYVSLSGEDQLAVYDLASGSEVRRVSLRAGDEPRELRLTPDGRLLVALNRRSDSAVFVDTDSFEESARVTTGSEPWALLLDRGGRRGYVLNRRSNDITILDLANRVVAGTVPTEPEPLRAQLNRDGSRLYVIHRGSPYLTVFQVPEMTVLNRIFVGMGAGALKVDARTDLVYVGREDQGQIQVFDPFSLLPIGSLEVPGPVSYLAIDDVENTLLAVMPSLHAVAVVELTSKRLRSVIEVGREPYQVAPAGERF